MKNKWEKVLYNDKNSLFKNIEDIKLKVKVMEDDVKMKEKVLHHSGGVGNPEIEKDVSNKIIELIRAKLTILENMDETKLAENTAKKKRNASLPSK